jgi:hypothetical protein
VLGGAEVKVRMRLMCVPMAVDESCQPHLFDPKDRLTSSGIKWLLDGTPIERSAALREPWADFPGTGHFNVTDGELAQLVQQSLAAPPVRDQLIVHTFGDRAIDKALGELELSAPAVVWNLRRPRIEHGDLIHPEQIDLAPAAAGPRNGEPPHPGRRRDRLGRRRAGAVKPCGQT